MKRSPKSKMPKDYYRKQRERRRDAEVALANRLGGLSRHVEDPAGSQAWIETGIWPRS